MHALVAVAALMHGVAQPAPQMTPPGDSLSRLIDGLEQSGKSSADKLDAVFFAMHGRFATGREHWLVKHKYGYELTIDAHIELRWASGHVSVFDPRWYYYPPRGSPKGLAPPTGLSALAAKPVLGYYHLPAHPLAEWVGYTGFVPNPLALPPVPWIPPGSSVPLPRVGAERPAPKKP